MKGEARKSGIDGIWEGSASYVDSFPLLRNMKENMTNIKDKYYKYKRQYHKYETQYDKCERQYNKYEKHSKEIWN